jgi:hypothetical protein
MKIIIPARPDCPRRIAQSPIINGGPDASGLCRRSALKGAVNGKTANSVSPKVVIFQLTHLLTYSLIYFFKI